MLINAPTIASGGPSRALVLKKWFKILIQVVGPNTVTVGTSKDEARNVLAGVQDGLQFNNANSTLPFQMWWKGELWVAGSAAGTYFVIIVPGLAPSVFEKGGGSCEEPSEGTD